MLVMSKVAPVSTGNIDIQLVTIRAVLGVRSPDALAAAWGTELLAIWGIDATSLIAEAGTVEALMHNDVTTPVPEQASSDQGGDGASDSGVLVVIVTVGVAAGAAATFLGL